MKAHEKIHYFIINFDKPEKKKEQKMFFSTKLNPKCLNNTIYFSHSLQNQHTLLDYFLIATLLVREIFLLEKYTGVSLLNFLYMCLRCFDVNHIFFFLKKFCFCDVKKKQIKVN